MLTHFLTVLIAFASICVGTDTDSSDAKPYKAMRVPRADSGAPAEGVASKIAENGSELRIRNSRKRMREDGDNGYSPEEDSEYSPKDDGEYSPEEDGEYSPEEDGDYSPKVDGSQRKRMSHDRTLNARRFTWEQRNKASGSMNLMEVDDASSLALKPDAVVRPLMVAPSGRIIVDLQSPYLSKALAFIKLFSEPRVRGDFFHEYQITKGSLIKAALMGLDKNKASRYLTLLSKVNFTFDCSLDNSFDSMRCHRLCRPCCQRWTW
jgi:hypothetical protein